MGKIGFIFPGQGAQAVGMGKEIIENNQQSQEIFKQAQSLLDFDLEKICFEENALIHQTDYTQPALLTVSIALLTAIQEKGIAPDMVAGLSLGEYSALVANGGLSFKDAVELVRKRGLYMETAAKTTKGTMAAIIGSEESVIQGVLDGVEGYVAIANYNNEKQIVISGEVEAVNKAVAKFTEIGIRGILLTVSGAFHSQLMKSAADALKLALEDITIHPFQIPYLTNVTGEVVTDFNLVKPLLVEQVYSSVRWEDNVKEMIKAGVDLFVEIGPGNTLAGLIKKIDRKVKVMGVSDLETLNKLVTYMEERA